MDINNLPGMRIEDVWSFLDAVEDINFNWLGVASCAKFLASDKRNTEEKRIAWAKIGIEAWRKHCELLAPETYFAPTSELGMRANLIADGIFNKEFSFRTIQITLDESIAEMDCDNLRKFLEKGNYGDYKSIEVKHLRRIKNLLRSVDLIVEGSHGVTLSERAAWWYSRRETLP